MGCLHEIVDRPLLPLPDDIVGTVDGEAVSRAAFDLQYPHTRIQRYEYFPKLAPLYVLRLSRQEAMRAAVNELLLAQRARALGVEFDEAELALRERRADRGLEADLTTRSREAWRSDRIAELRANAILRAEGWRSGSDDEWLAVLRGMFANGFMRGASIALTELRTYDRAEGERLQALLRVPGADVEELAREFSCARSAVYGGWYGVYPERSIEACLCRGLGVGEVGEVDAPYDHTSPGARQTWRLLVCRGRWDDESVLHSEVAAAAVRGMVEPGQLAAGRARLLRRLRRAAQIVDHVEATMPREQVEVELPEIVAEVAGHRVRRGQLLAELEPILLEEMRMRGRTLLACEHRLARNRALVRIVERTRMIDEALREGMLTESEAAARRERVPDLGTAPEAAAPVVRTWAAEERRVLARLLQRLPDDAPQSDLDAAARRICARLQWEQPARYELGGDVFDDDGIESAIGDDDTQITELHLASSDDEDDDQL